MKSCFMGVAIAAFLVGCGTTTPTPMSAPVPAPIVAEGSMVKQYENSAQLAGDATLLVVGEVVNSSRVQIGDLTFTKYMVKVVESVAGGAEGELAVYVVGAPGWKLSLEIPDYFQEGDSYALFLRPTELPKGSVGAEGYYIVGMGAWAQSSDSTFHIWLDPARNVGLAKIPTTFAAADIADVLSADKVGSTR